MKLCKHLFTAFIVTSFSLTLGACREMPSNQASGTNSAQIPQANANPQDAPFVKMLSELQAKNPQQEAQAAIARGERYFLCNAGRSRSVPGLTAEVYANARESCPSKCLEGVTDALYGENHAKYLSAALAYSAQWNQTMLAACY